MVRTKSACVTCHNDTAYRGEVEWLTHWCPENNLSQCLYKTKDMKMYLGCPALLVTLMTEDLACHATAPPWPRRPNSVSTASAVCREPVSPQPILSTFYMWTIKSVLTSCITVWYGNCNNSDHKSLQGIVKSAKSISGTSLLSFHGIYTKRCTNRTSRIIRPPPIPPNDASPEYILILYT